ncbi:MAG: HAD family phosphatase [Solirubrobacterales bacterium]
MAEIRAVVSDFGGVLTTPLMTAFLALQDEHGISPEHFAEAMGALREQYGEVPLYALERGEMTEGAFLEMMREVLEPVLGHRPELHRFRETFIGGLQPNPEMIELMAELGRSGLRMAMLTNNVREWEPLWRPMLPVDEIFEIVVDSAFVGCRKPEPRIYELTIERLGLPAAECLFVDDLEVNCEAARDAGMNAVHFRDNEQAIAEIRGSVAAAG